MVITVTFIVFFFFFCLVQYVVGRRSDEPGAWRTMRQISLSHVARHQCLHWNCKSNLRFGHCILSVLHGTSANYICNFMTPKFNVFAFHLQIDRLCLNCHRMEQTDCECPCECPFEMNTCNGQVCVNNELHPQCPPFFEEEMRPAYVDSTVIDALPSCYDVNCYEKQSESACLGVLGCEWCEFQMDGQTPLRETFCIAQKSCFGGVFGAKTPYADEIVEGMDTSDDYYNFRSSEYRL